jgi:hypothetical protein
MEEQVMAEVTRDELNARFEALRLEIGSSKAEVLLAVKEEVHTLRIWVLTGAVAALCSLLGVVVTNLPHVRGAGVAMPLAESRISPR